MLYIINILSFLKNNKYLIYIIGVLLVLLACFLTYKTIYNKGYNEGTLYQKNVLDKEYQEILKKRISENNDKLKSEYDILLSNAQAKVIIQKEYVNKIKEVEKIIYKSKTLNQCEMSDEELEFFNKK